ncbi:HsdM family class I SAM-dependent methyltransferase [Candidatus Phytoplasma meliae]|uniref:site-specific DNA-methyltransferase (adenine-specific) n=1 Tax=Candidatus Phytoplasma meliae TaxID=1848402 RepID=A0ABS5CZ74_9MOLU|nr:N-6 DNA methylase [Candidatus Phytoplasma meliae]MBP5836280.1 N-6 DNA methylase [Candidatus Phytoplasma meliae]
MKKSMANERKTENLVRKMLKQSGYYDNESTLIEEQKSDNPRIDKLLQKASKSGRGKGYPDFIISFCGESDKIILIECKAETTKHESKDGKQYKDYAVDGVLLYASYFKDEYNVVAIAVSGQNEREQQISTFLWLKESYRPKDIQNKFILNSKQLTEQLTQQAKPLRESELLSKAIEYNNLLHNYGIPEVERCTVISSILLSLQDNVFIYSYKNYIENKELMKGMIDACERVLKNAQKGLQGANQQEKIKVIIAEYSKYKYNKTLTKSEKIEDKKTKKIKPNTLLKDLIKDIHDNILPHIKHYNFEILGKFYTQFIRYAGSDAKTGLVLTPIHITDLFCDLVDVQANDVVLDPCCGTGGFLVSAMNAMLKDANGDIEKQKKIKSNNLIGIEKRSDMFSHACSNMIMRGDGKSNIYHDDFFDLDKKTESDIKGEGVTPQPNISFLNPPYRKGEHDEQLQFVEKALSFLKKDGKCVAICQMSMALNTKALETKKRLLQNHTLDAVLSMPTDLFHPIAVPTVVLIFKAHIPHNSKVNTFFGYYKNDGFIKQKHKGRLDVKKEWNDIKEQWLHTYRNRENTPGLSVNHPVKYNDEWVAEAYMKTDYTTLTDQDFVNKIKELVAFEFLNNSDNYEIS